MQTYNTKQFKLLISKTDTHLWRHFSKKGKLMTLNEIIKSENHLLALHHISQCLPLSLKYLLTNENDPQNYITWNSANLQLALPQEKTTNYGLHSIRYRTTKYWNSVQNSLNLNFANNFASSKRFLKAFKKNSHSDNPTIALYFQRYSINLIVCL